MGIEGTPETLTQDPNFLNNMEVKKRNETLADLFDILIPKSTVLWPMPLDDAGASSP